MSRRDTRGGPMMVGPAAFAWNAGMNTDWRKRLSVGLNYDQSDDRLGRGGRRRDRPRRSGGRRARGRARLRAPR